jgi:hypothetical protein
MREILSLTVAAKGQEKVGLAIELPHRQEMAFRQDAGFGRRGGIVAQRFPCPYA